jgi:pyridoxamine 5'-phosphate oxidase
MTLWDPPAGFDQPLAALAACHRRIEKQMHTLARLQKHIARNGVDDEARAAIEGVLKYFIEAAPNHHADEELDLFPRVLRAAEGSADRASAFDLIAHLMVEHRDMEEVWDRVHEALDALLAGGAAELDPQLIRDFARIYADHIFREEKQLFPLAEKLLKSPDWVALGTAMAARRGLPAPQFHLAS